MLWRRSVATLSAKGWSHARDTVNFIGNRIGCFWMLSGLHKAKPYLADGLSIETIDALMGGAPGSTVDRALRADRSDRSRCDGLRRPQSGGQFAAGRYRPRFHRLLPATEQALLSRGQLGRKSGGGFYRVVRQEDGSKVKEVFDLIAESWRAVRPVSLGAAHSDAATLLFSGTPEGHFSWDLIGKHFALCGRSGAADRR